MNTLVSVPARLLGHTRAMNLPSLTVSMAEMVAALSPDGSKLAIGLSEGNNDDIWVKPIPRGAAYRVSYDPGSDSRPRWTRDGRFVTVDGLNIRYLEEGSGVPAILLHGASLGSSAGATR